jgi:hypothetical protein
MTDNYEEEEDPAEYENTAPAYTMYGISDVNNDFDRRCIPDEDVDEFEHDVEHLPDFETRDEYEIDEGGPNSVLPWASQFDAMPIKVVINMSTSSKGTLVARVQNKKKVLELQDFESYGMDSDVASLTVLLKP